MDHTSAALFRILFQHETLFRLDDGIVADIAPISVKEPEPKPQPQTSTPETPPIANATPPTPVVVKTEATPAPTPAPDPFPALKHKVLVLIDEQKQSEMLVSEALFLDNILKAVSHSIETSDIINFSFLPGQDARTVLSGKKTNFFISFGVPLIKLQLDLLLAPYTPKMIEGVWFLLTDPLVVIEADRNLKKKLWQALQKMFEMS